MLGKKFAISIFKRSRAPKWAEAFERWELEDKKTRGAKPTLRRHVLNDTTVEAAGKIFAENPHGLLVERDELAGWFGAMDKYSSGKGAAADRGFWLTAFNGGTYTVDRISRASNFIENLSASVLGGIQPDAIRRVMADAVDDGLIQRLIPVILPPAGVGEDIPNKDAFQNYGALVYRLTKLPEIGEPSPNDPHNYNQVRRHAVFDAGGYPAGIVASTTK